jgi:dienelactone hydrolase
MKSHPSREQPLTVEQSEGPALAGILHVPNRSGPRPVVVVCHGFKGFMEWGFFPALCSLLADRGFAVVRFNYSGAGQRPGEEQTTDLDAFRRNTHSRELQETLAVIDALRDGLGGDCVDPTRIGLVGHSRGGATALLAAADPRAAASVRALVTWAAVATFDRYQDEAKQRWRSQGELTVLNGRTGQELSLGLDLLEDIEAHTHGGRLDLEVAAAPRTMPWLIVHASADEGGLAEQAHRLDRAASGLHELREIDGAGHSLGAQHPFVGPTAHLTAALNATQAWLRRHLP